MKIVSVKRRNIFGRIQIKILINKAQKKFEKARDLACRQLEELYKDSTEDLLSGLTWNEVWERFWDVVFSLYGENGTNERVILISYIRTLSITTMKEICVSIMEKHVSEKEAKCNIEMVSDVRNDQE